MRQWSTLAGVAILLTILSCGSALAAYEHLILMRDETFEGIKSFTFVIDFAGRSIDLGIYCRFAEYKGNTMEKGQLVDGYIEFDGKRVLTDKRSSALITTVGASPGKHTVRVGVTSPTGPVWVGWLRIRNDTENASVGLRELK